MGIHIYQVRNENTCEIALTTSHADLHRFKEGFLQAVPERFWHWDVASDPIIITQLEGGLNPADAAGFLRSFPRHSLPLGWRLLEAR
jgi:hypothetical protein